MRSVRDLLLVSMLLVPAALWATAPEPRVDGDMGRALKEILLTKQDVLMGACPDGQVLQGVEADGSTTCVSVAADVHSHAGAAWKTARGTALSLESHEGVALELRGALRVPPSSRAPVFVHTATSASITGDRSELVHPLANARPDAMLVVTPRDERVRSAAVSYDETRRAWFILTGDGKPMPEGARFNVLVVLP